jgi:hypothetical protein
MSSQLVLKRVQSLVKSSLVRRLSSDLADQELWCLAHGLITVGQVSSSNDKRTSADHVACGAEDLGPVSGVVGNLATVLHVLGVAE